MKDLERQLESRPTAERKVRRRKMLAKMQLAIGKRRSARRRTKKNREVKKRNKKESGQRSACTVAKVCDPIESGSRVKITKAELKAECLMH